jgi:CRP-like cAMP-binding protein
LATLDDNQRNLLWNISQSQEFQAGETILEFENEPRGIYILIDGQITCQRVSGPTVKEVDRITTGGTFGEYWLLMGLPTKVRFIADVRCRIRVIDRRTFNELLDRNGTLARKIYKHFAQSLLKRLVNTDFDNKTRKSS